METNKKSTATRLSKLDPGYEHSKGSRRSAEQASTLYVYSNIFPNKGIPSYLDFPLNWGVPLTLISFIEFELGFTKVWESFDMDFKVSELPFTKNAMFVNHTGYMISITCSWTSETSNDNRARKLIQTIKSMGLDSSAEKSALYSIKKSGANKSTSYMYIDEIEIYSPGPEFRDDEEFKSIMSKLTPYIRSQDPEETTGKTSKIHMLVKEDYDMYFKDFDVSKFTPDLIEPNIFYGNGFDEWHESLLDRVTKEKKGVVLFHGLPGTGKTHYIRYLLKELSKREKRVVYIPPALVEAMTDPGVTSFLTQNIIEEERDTILLIEDAEPLLESRNSQGNVRTAGISNLLNSTDGILNDILGIMVIATFNTELGNIDPALLRPGRLIARKEFKKIKKENLGKAATILGVKLDAEEIPNDSYSVAELINLKKSTSTLLHDHEDNTRKIGFGV